MLWICLLGFLCVMPTFAAQSKILIVFAHQEPQSFCFAMRNRIFQSLIMKKHQVKMTNLVQQGMTLSLARTDFTELYNGSYFHPQYEQLMSNKNGRSTFSKQLRVEHDKVQWADTILFVFPYYVMYVPSIMKSWMERVFSDGFAYNSTGGLGGRKAMLLYSTGADKDFLKEIEPVFWAHIHGNFKFMNLTSLKPFTAYAVAQKTDEERKKYLDEVEKIMYDLENREIYEP